MRNQDKNPVTEVLEQSVQSASNVEQQAPIHPSVLKNMKHVDDSMISSMMTLEEIFQYGASDVATPEIKEMARAVYAKIEEIMRLPFFSKVASMF